jgi:hypothetical protein
MKNKQDNFEDMTSEDITECAQHIEDILTSTNVNGPVLNDYPILDDEQVEILTRAYLSYLEDTDNFHNFALAANWLSATQWHFGGNISDFVKTCKGA